MLFPKAEEIIDARITRGEQTRWTGPNSRLKSPFFDLLVHLGHGDYANMADVDGVNFQEINVDICHYVWDTCTE